MRKLTYTAAFAVICIVASNANAATIANCGSASGWAYYAQGGAIGAANAGWDESKVTGGKTTLTLSNAGDFDVLFVDATGVITSATAEGATIKPIRFGPNEIAVTVDYPGATFEIHSYVRDGAGKPQLLMLQSRSPDTPFTSAAVRVAPCERLDIETLEAMVSARAAAAATDAAAAAAQASPARK